MKYSDPHHKRTHFSASSFVSEKKEAGRQITFSGQGLHASVALAERGSSLVAIVPEIETELNLWKIQILESQKWLTLDFQPNAELSRILVHLDRLDVRELALAVTEAVGTKSLLFHQYAPEEPNQTQNQSRRREMA